MRRKLISVCLGLLVMAGWLASPGPAQAPVAELERLWFEEPLHVWRGTASWYGPGFHGRLTASGEVFDMYANTAAHLTLPLGSLVRVVNPRTGQSRVVRITDRGPYIEGREIDVSYDVARSLGFEERGLARLQIELLEVPRGRWSPPRETAEN
jgi:rare lipoprotein A (peptidoglycan hydrolase)